MGIQLANIAEGGMGSSGFRHTDEHKEHLRKNMLENNPMSDPLIREKQKILVKNAMSRPDVKLRQSAARIGIKFSTSHIESLKNCHPMRPCAVNGVEYKSLMEASRAVGVRHGTLFRWLNNQAVKHNKKYAHIVEARWL
jgi:hypothetical protein